MRVDDDFGTALRTLRQRLTPGEAGVPASLPTVRRVPGLRRDELAGLVGVSEEHVKRLEQSRRRPSPGVVDALARALRLTPAEHARLRALAGFAASPEPDGMVPREITEGGPSVFRAPERLAGFRATVVAELREAARRYPADAELSSMITDLHARSPQFVQLWDAPPLQDGHADRLRVPSRVHGHLDLDLDVLTLTPGDLRVVVYTMA